MQAVQVNEALDMPVQVKEMPVQDVDMKVKEMSVQDVDMPAIPTYVEENNVLRFTVQNISVSMANGLRRIMLSDIPTLCLKMNSGGLDTKNTSQFNTEILDIRLKCLPIHFENAFDPDQVVFDEVKNYEIRLNEENKTNDPMYVNTDHFKIFANHTEVLEPKIHFGHFKQKFAATIVRLRPNEAINLTCSLEFRAVNHAEAEPDSAFNVVSTCAYQFTPETDKAILETAWQKFQPTDLTETELKVRRKDWDLLDAKRIYKEKSFDFIIESVGTYHNAFIFLKAIKVLQAQIAEVVVEKNLTLNENITIEHCYELVLLKNGYTVGKVLEQHLQSKPELTYCGFLKPHPHDPKSILRIAFKADGKDEAKYAFEEAQKNAIKACEMLLQKFKSRVKGTSTGKPPSASTSKPREPASKPASASTSASKPPSASASKPREPASKPREPAGKPPSASASASASTGTGTGASASTGTGTGKPAALRMASSVKPN